MQCSNACNTNIHCFLMNFLKNSPTPNKSNHKQVQFGSYNNLVIFCLIGKMVQNEVRLEIHFCFQVNGSITVSLFEPRWNAFQRRYIYLPVFSRKTQPYQWDEVVKILLGSYEEEYFCKSQPIDVSNNVTFLNIKFKFEGCERYCVR